MNFDIQKINKFVQTADTDSIIMSLVPILEQQYPDLDLNNKEEVLPKIKIIQKEIGHILNEYQSTIAKEILNCDEHFFDLKPEFIFQKAYFSGKRRYAQYLIDREGNKIEKFVIMGLDIMKSNFPPLFRNFGEGILKKILLGHSKSDIDIEVMEFKKSLANIPWKQLLKPTGLKKLDEYIERKPLPGELFSKLKLKCPVNTKAAIFSNDIIRFNNLNPQYPEFSLGDKMYIAMLKPNPYQLTVIGLNGYNDPPHILEIVEKYIDREGLFDSIIRNKLENLYADLNWSLQLNEHITQFFDFG